MRARDLVYWMRVSQPVLSILATLSTGCVASTTEESEQPAVYEGAICDYGYWWNASTESCDYWGWPVYPEDPPWEPSTPPGGGDPEPSAGCTEPTAAQQTEYARARSKALCALSVGRCNTLLSTAESGSPWQILSDLDTRGEIKLNCPPDPTDDPSTGTFTLATTFGSGMGNQATIWIRPPFYGHPPYIEALYLIHEIGHASGRIDPAHGT